MPVLEDRNLIQRKSVRVIEQAGVGASSFPVSLEVRADKSDIRVTIAGAEVPSQIEVKDGKCATVTFQIDLEPNQIRDDVVLHFVCKRAGSLALLDKSWGKIFPTMDGFENELMRISYGLKTGTYGKEWGCQNEFTIKSLSENLVSIRTSSYSTNGFRIGSKSVEEDQFGGSAVPQSWGKSRNDVTYWKENVPAKFGEIEIDGPVYKRVRFSTDEVISDDHGGLKNLSQRVTFYRNCPFIKEEYENIKGSVVDVATPGGMPLRIDKKRNFDYVASNFDSKLITWNGIGNDKETRGGWDASRERAEKDPRYRYLNEYTYNGYFVMGVFNIHNGRGIASCALAENIRTCYFVDWPHERAGYSLWPRGDGRMNRYLYYVENGRNDILSLGKLLANPPRVILIP